MTDLTAADLFGGGEEESSSDSGGGGGQFALDMIDKLDSKGLLQPLILGDQREIEEIQQSEQPEPDPQPEAVPDGGTQMDSAEIKGLLLQVYDNTGMIPGMDDDPSLSEIIKLVDSNPEMVDQLIEEHL